MYRQKANKKPPYFSTSLCPEKFPETHQWYTDLYQLVALYIIHSTLYTEQWNLYTEQWNLYTEQYTLYTVQCTMCT